VKQYLVLGNPGMMYLLIFFMEKVERIARPSKLLILLSYTGNYPGTILTWSAAAGTYHFRTGFPRLDSSMKYWRVILFRN
jgi:hypothetical protein